MKLANISFTLRILIIMVLFVVINATHFEAASTNNLAVIYVGNTGDAFFNYDFISQYVSSTNVDWAISLVFYVDAEVDRVKWGVVGGLPFGSAMYLYLNDGQGWIWDSDGGVKRVVNDPNLGYVYLHVRVYAPPYIDYMYNSYWGKYVLGSIHYDDFPLERWSGWSEWAENYLVNDLSSRGYTVYSDAVYFYNFEAYRVQGGHIWLNNGYATFIEVPPRYIVP